MDIGNLIDKDIIYHGTKTFCWTIFEFLKKNTSLTIDSVVFSTNFMFYQIQKFKKLRKDQKDCKINKSKYLKNNIFFQ